MEIAARVLFAVLALANLIDCLVEWRGDWLVWPRGRMRFVVGGWLIATGIAAIAGLSFDLPCRVFTDMSPAAFSTWFAFSIWRRHHPTDPWRLVPAQLHAAADEPRNNTTDNPDPSRAARG